MVDCRRSDCRLDHRKNHDRLRLRGILDIVLGIIGAVVGGFIMRTLGFAGQGGMVYTIIVAVIGAVILTWIVRLIKTA